MRSRRLLLLWHVDMRSRAGEQDIRSIEINIVVNAHEDHRVGEARVKVDGPVDLLDLLPGQRQRKRVDVLLEVFDLATTDDGEDVGGLVERPRESLSVLSAFVLVMESLF